MGAQLEGTLQKSLARAAADAGFQVETHRLDLAAAAAAVLEPA